MEPPVHADEIDVEIESGGGKRISVLSYRRLSACIGGSISLALLHL
jgi:hypothetical protein